MLETLPLTLALATAGYEWHLVMTGCSTATVHRLEKQGEPQLYLKCAPAPELEAEARRLAWLQGRLPVPALQLFVTDDGINYLLMSAVSGVDATYFNDRPGKEPVVRLLAEGLRVIHSVDTSNCPFDQRLPARIEAARQRLAAGLVDESDFDEERLGREAADLFDEVWRTRPVEEDLVFTHGDYCLPNVIIDHDAIAGFIDLGSAGVADRYQDLALGARSLASNFGPEWLPLFFETYGIARPDRVRMTFYKLLDEFF